MGYRTWDGNLSAPASDDALPSDVEDKAHGNRPFWGRVHMPASTTAAGCLRAGDATKSCWSFGGPSAWFVVVAR